MVRKGSLSVVATIQARMGSRRLPNKAFLKIAGKNPIQWIAHRLHACQSLDGVWLATTIERKDDPLAAMAKQLKIPCYRGPEKDLILRLLGAARAAKADAVVRVTADCPLVDPQLVDRMVESYRAHPRIDFVTNVYPPSYPDGLDLDILPRKTLERMDQDVKDPLHREWLTTYILERPKRFRILNIASDSDARDLRWTLDYPEDLRFLRTVFGHFIRRKQSQFGMNAIIRLLEQQPQLKKINARRIDRTILKGIRSHVYHTLAKKTLTRRAA
jgi:spore coat polysaccharide biosynthesis protein SpsF